MTVKKIEAQPAEKKKLRVAAYCRVSTDNDDQRESLETQKAHYEAWIRLHSEWECAGIFYDFGITGTKGKTTTTHMIKKILEEINGGKQ